MRPRAGGGRLLVATQLNIMFYSGAIIGRSGRSRDPQMRNFRSQQFWFGWIFRMLLVGRLQVRWGKTVDERARSGGGGGGLKTGKNYD